MSEQEQGSPDSDGELAALVEEFAFRRTYRPTDGMAEPEELPQGPSGSVMGGPGETAPPAQEPDTP
ncbi:hypothetical protein [Streptomyces sp. NPDC019224]|uniref:hypothetical protein n=1 Tax=Streptomyces sp. NPDC019224 TaxID=3154484 RepID=UPI0033EE2E44